MEKKEFNNIADSSNHTEKPTSNYCALKKKENKKKENGKIEESLSDDF